MAHTDIKEKKEMILTSVAVPEARVGEYIIEEDVTRHEGRQMPLSFSDSS